MGAKGGLGCGTYSGIVERYFMLVFGLKDKHACDFKSLYIIDNNNKLLLKIYLVVNACICNHEIWLNYVEFFVINFLFMRMFLEYF